MINEERRRTHMPQRPSKAMYDRKKYLGINYHPEYLPIEDCCAKAGLE